MIWCWPDLTTGSLFLMPSLNLINVQAQHCCPTWVQYLRLKPEEAASQEGDLTWPWIERPSLLAPFKISVHSTPLNFASLSFSPSPNSPRSLQLDTLH